MRSRPLEIAVIGAGLMGRWHAATARRLGARVAAVVDPDLASASRLAREYGARALPTLESLLQETGPTVAHVCTPLSSHVATCDQLLRAGLHVLCEKPLAATSDEVVRLQAVAAQAGRRLCPVHQFATQRGVEQLLQRRATLAPLAQLAFTFCTAGAAGRPVTEQRQLLLDVLPHPLAVLGRLLPDAELGEVRWHVHHPAPGEMLATCVLASVPVSIFISCTARPTVASAVIRGAGGTATLDFFHGFASFHGATVSRVRKISQPLVDPLGDLLAAGTNLARRLVSWEPAYPGLRAWVRAFYHSIDAPERLPAADRDVVAVYQARDAIAAALEGRP